MTELAAELDALKVNPGQLAISWLGQAGFVFKTSSGAQIFIDAYLSAMCEKVAGNEITSKRMIPPPLRMEEIQSGWMIATHAHEDHLDQETVSFVAQHSPDVRFAGPISCIPVWERLGVPSERIHILELDRPHAYNDLLIRAVYADHGEAEPDAVGIMIESDGIRIYHTGDTCYCPERMQTAIDLQPQVLIACINGTYGNLNGIEAACLAYDIGARIAIPCHYWFFIGQNTNPQGTPAAFLEGCAAYAPQTQHLILRVGEVYLVQEVNHYG